jgi:predicted DNA-binding transcriptional regulator AlpA
MMTGDDRQPVAGEIVGPEGDGQWLPVPEASRITGTAQKTLYRRVEQNRIPSRKNADGRIEVWIAATVGTVAQERGLSPIVGVNLAEVRDLLTPLAQVLADSQQEALTAMGRAVKAETELSAALAEIEALKARQSESRTERIGGFRGWLRRWLLLDRDDSQ